MGKGTVLFIVTSNEKLGDTGNKTGLHYEELATPYYYFEEQGYETAIASIKGGVAPIDPSSMETDAESVARFKQDENAQEKLKNTKYIGDILAEDYAGAFIPGGHGTMWDLPDDDLLIKTLESFWAQQKPIAAVCHGPAAFVNIKDTQGNYIVDGRRVNCFTDAEEKYIELDDAMPFLLETKLKDRGAKFENSDLFEPHSVRDGMLVSGQNPASAKGTAEKMHEAMEENAQLNKAP